MIYHIATTTDWENAINKDVYIPSRYLADGFIHCSTNSQIERILNTLFKNHTKVLLLFIDDTKEQDFIKYENLEGGIELFPHIYRVLAKDSIIKIISLKKSIDDIFILPNLND